MITPYASWTGTKTTLQALQCAGWRLLLSATGHHSRAPEGFRYALDNGAWTAYQQQAPFNFVKFVKALAAYGANADWVVAPDIVEGGAASLELSLSWLRYVQSETTRVLIAVQDGVVHNDIAAYLKQDVGIFIGGSTPWKLATLGYWGDLGRRCNCWVHVGRVNSMRRIRLCAVAGAHSFDGTSVTKFPSTLPRLHRAVVETKRTT